MDHPRGKLINMLLQEKGGFSMDIMELKMRVQEPRNKLKIEHVVHKTMHAD